MSKGLLAALLVLQAHFAASYLVPLDREAQETLGALLRWAWSGGTAGRWARSRSLPASHSLASSSPWARQGCSYSRPWR
jgi:hypothetical protein